MSGTVFRVVATKGFTTLQNETINDRRLSPEALGVLIRLASKPDGWEVRAHNIESENNIARDKRRRIFAELESAGYAARFKTQNKKGQWIRVTEVYVVSKKPAEGGFSGVGKSDAGSPGDGKPGHLIKTNEDKNIKKNKKQQHEFVEQPSAAARGKKIRRVRESGIVTYYDDDPTEAGRIEREYPADQVCAAVAAVASTGKQPVPGLVEEQIEKTARRREEEARREKQRAQREAEEAAGKTPEAKQKSEAARINALSMLPPAQRPRSMR
jgi:hypothetical protein